MRAVDVASVDLNLLEALLAEGHVTRAARRLHMSQPAVSRALARLRNLLGDELLVRVGQRMHPTRPHRPRRSGAPGRVLECTNR